VLSNSTRIIKARLFVACSSACECCLVAGKKNRSPPSMAPRLYAAGQATRKYGFFMGCRPGVGSGGARRRPRRLHGSLFREAQFAGPGVSLLLSDSSRASRAALSPEPPVKPPAWVRATAAQYKFASVAFGNVPHPAVRRMVKNWVEEPDRRVKICPPVSDVSSASPAE